MVTLTLQTRQRNELIDITSRIAELVRESGVTSGVCYIFVPHTTAGLTINEDADPDVVADLLMKLQQVIPQHDLAYRHTEGNSDAHIKASLFGPSQVVFIEAGRLVLGTWQGIYFCEFDGPRTRKVLVKIVAD
ncbi:MAG: YjbQ family protein [Firmicutes bacterium]|nr:YjbQ family protein [Bacillota bacterium]